MEVHHISSITWDQYRRDVGYQTFQKSPRIAFRNFEMNYFGKNVGWTGYVIRVNLNEDDPMSLAYHTANIMIKMETSDMPEG